MRGRHLHLVNCGHRPPLLLQGAGAAPVLLDTGPAAPPLGLGCAPEAVRSRWAPGARLLFYTDGLVEARSAAGQFFPLAEHAAVLADPSLDRSLDRLVERLLGHTGRKLDDDMALVLAEHQ